MKPLSLLQPIEKTGLPEPLFDAYSFNYSDLVSMNEQPINTQESKESKKSDVLCTTGVNLSPAENSNEKRIIGGNDTENISINSLITDDFQHNKFRKIIHPPIMLCC